MPRPGEGVPFDQIAILLRSPERHQPLILEALRRAGIPVSCTLGARRPDVAGRSLLALLHCAEEGLSASRFAEYLSLGQVPGDETPVTPAQWERLLVDAAVIGGVSRWEARLAGLREEFHRRHAEAEDDEARERLAGRIQAVENLTRLALPIIARLDALPKRALWGEWIAALAELAEFALSEPERVIELLEELEPMSPIGPVSLAEVLLVLGPRLNSLNTAPKESRFGKVWLGSVEEARGMAFRRVFVPGLNEGLFPRPPAEDPLLLHAQRSELGIELRADDTELLGIAVACASERLHLSFSRLDLLTGRERVPSFYAFEAHRAAGGREIERARVRIARALGHPDAHRLARAGRCRRRDRRCRVRSRHARPARRRLRPISQEPARPLGGIPAGAVGALAQAVESGRRAHRGRNRQRRFGALPALAARLVALGAAAVRALSLSLRPARVFGLRAAEQPTGIQRMDPATRGELYHAVQFELLREPEPLARLDEVLERVAGALRSRSGAGHSADLARRNPGHPRRSARLAATAGRARAGLDAAIR
jgi:ATP-dependent helicase/nuclease subunit B